MADTNNFTEMILKLVEVRTALVNGGMIDASANLNEFIDGLISQIGYCERDNLRVNGEQSAYRHWMEVHKVYASDLYDDDPGPSLEEFRATALRGLEKYNDLMRDVGRANLCE